MHKVNNRKGVVNRCLAFKKCQAFFFEKMKRIATNSRLSGKKGSEGDGTD